MAKSKAAARRTRRNSPKGSERRTRRVATRTAAIQAANIPATTTTRKRRTGKKTSASRVRPVVYSKGGELYAPKRSKYLRSGTRINPKETRRKARRNPAKRAKLLAGIVPQRTTMIRTAKIGGGFLGGALAMPLVDNALNRVVPTSLQGRVGNYYGLAHVLIGLVMYKRSKRFGEVGIGIAASGLYDVSAMLINQQFPGALLPVLPRVGGFAGLVDRTEAPAPQAATYYPEQGLSANYQPQQLSANYQPQQLSANYETEFLGDDTGYSDMEY